MVATLVADLLWVNAELRGDYEVGGGSDVGLFRASTSACSERAGAAARRAAAGADTLGLQGDLRGSLPIVALIGRHHRAARRSAAARPTSSRRC